MKDIILKKAAVYDRCSTNSQDHSPEQQYQFAINYAKKNRYEIVREYTDRGVSGTDFNRPAFQQMKRDIENGADFGFVLCYDESRWGRSGDGLSTYYKTHFKLHGVVVIILNSYSNNENNMVNHVMQAIEIAEAHEYVVKLSRATLRGMKDNAARGFSCGGSPPFGYFRLAIDKNSGQVIRKLESGMRSFPNEKVIFEIEPSEAEIVNRIFNLKLQGIGVNGIANALNKDNVPTPKRGKWKNKDQKWSGSTVLGILTNLTYTGARVFNRHPQSHLSGPSKPLWFNPKEEWVIKEGSHAQIISEELFNEVNKSRKPYTRSNRYFAISPYLLAGILRCKNCGFSFQGQTRKLISKKTGKKYQLSYYQDSGYQNKGRAVCSSYLMRKEELENVVISQIKILITNDNFLKKIYKIIEDKLFNTYEIDSLLANYKKQIDNNRKVLQNLIELIRNGVNLVEVQDEIFRINKEIEFLQNNYYEAKNKKVDKSDIKAVVDKLKTLIDNFESTFNNAPLHIQKNIIRQFVSKMIVDPTANTIHIYFRRVPWIDDELSKKDIYGLDEVKISLNGQIKASRRTAKY